MRCKKCGYFNDSANAFCGGCGKKLVNDGRNNNLLLILLGILIAILIVIIVYFAAGIIRKESEAATENVKTTFSATIGEVNGTVYSITDDIPYCSKLPVHLDNSTSVSSFCYYDGYVYYIVCESGSSDYNSWLYRCDVNFSSIELLDEMRWGDSANFPQRYFLIDNGVLYYLAKGGETVNAIKLDTLTKITAQVPVFSVNCGATTYTSASEDVQIRIYNDTVLFTDAGHNLYRFENGESIMLASDAYLDGGCTKEYIYYAQFGVNGNTSNCNLCRMPVSGGNYEVLSSRMPAGGGGPYFCY